MELRSEYNEYRISVPKEFENIFTHFYFAANTSEYKEIPRRVLAVDESIRGYASVADVVAFSADLSGVEQDLVTEYIP